MLPLHICGLGLTGAVDSSSAGAEVLERDQKLLFSLVLTIVANGQDKTPIPAHLP